MRLSTGRAEGLHDSPAAGSALDPMTLAENSPESIVPLHALTLGFYLREHGTDAAHVRLLADAAEFARLPPILVQKSTSRVIDGMHRFEVAKRRGESAIRARVVDCTDEEALVLAIKSNTLHGLPLSKAERISSAKRILAAHPDWSDRAVAGIAGLSAKSIASLRSASAADPQVRAKRVGRDGKRRPAVAGEGRLRAAEYITAHPEASLRQVARETDVSVGTVQDVRAKMRNALSAQEEPGRPDDTANDASPAEIAAPTVTRIPRPRGRPDSSRQLAWAAISAKITNDPALRYTEGGRAFLRWMSMRCMEADDWREFADAIPHRWLSDIEQIATDMSKEWCQFADQLRRRQERAM